jgi:ABC-type sugar transport system ATPase subunit
VTMSISAKHAAERQPSPFFEAIGVSKAYKGVAAVKQVCLQVYAGEVVGLVGKNGAGKSTLLKVVAGAVASDSGEIRLNGMPVAIRNPHHANDLGIALVFQEIADVPMLSVAENIQMGQCYPRRKNGLIDWVALRERTVLTLRRLDSNIDPDVPAGNLSVANRKLVMIARALSRDARLVILDEPSASLSDSEIKQLFNVVRTLKAMGVAVIYVSHRLEEIFALTDRIVVMRDGAQVASARTPDIDMGELIRHITGRVNDGDDRHVPPPPVSAGKEVLRVDSLSVGASVSNASFNLRAGEVLGIAGLVGSGRTELVRAVFGAERAASGRIWVGGREQVLRNPKAALRAGIALLPEDRRHQGLILEFSVRANTTLASLPKHRLLKWLALPSRKKERAATMEFVRKLSIRTPHVETEVAQLSGGNQQKVVLAKWLERGADVFIFDEPTQGIDVQTKEEIYSLCGELAKAGKGVIFISSEFGELVRVCHRAIVMRAGRIVAEVGGRDLDEANLVRLCYADAS